MEWSNPELFDLSIDSRESKKCVNGETPSADCVEGAIKQGHTCNGGSHAPLCGTGYGGAPW